MNLFFCLTLSTSLCYAFIPSPGQFNQRLTEVRASQQSVLANNEQLFDALQVSKLLQAASTNASISAKCKKECDVLAAAVGSLTLKLLDGSTDPPTVTERIMLQMADASSKLSPGLLWGRSASYGLFTECRKIDEKVVFLDNTTGVIRGGYFRVVAGGQNGTSSMSVNICLPRSCSDEDTATVVHDLLAVFKIEDTVTEVFEVNSKVQKKSFGTFIVYIIVFGLFGLSVLVGLVDYLYGEELRKHSMAKGTRCFAKQCQCLEKAFKFLMSFSLYQNVLDIFDTKETNKSGRIAVIPCMGFFSMCWVITGQTFLMYTYFTSNPLDVMQAVHDWGTQVLTQSHLAVDTFFFISGLLLAFVWFKDYNNHPKTIMSPPRWIKFYLHRFLRLSPSYYLALLFYTYVFHTWLHGMPLLQSSGYEDNNCLNNIWINFLYLTNFVRVEEQCYSISWYLATSFQIYLFTPLVLVAFSFTASTGLVVSACIIVLSIAANMATVLKYYFPPTDITFGALDPRMTEHGYTIERDYTLLIHNAPWIRCSVYVMGMMVGYFLQSRRSLRIPKVINLVLWILAGVCLSLPLFGLHTYTKGNYWSLGLRASFSAFNKPLWALGLSWIVVSCFYGPINSFMSWKIFVPLGRLTFCAYLLHIMVVVYVIGLNRGDLLWSSFTQAFVNYAIPSILLSYFFALFWSATFEVSLRKNERIFLGRLHARQVEDKLPQADNEKPFNSETFPSTTESSISFVVEKPNPPVFETTKTNL